MSRYEKLLKLGPYAVFLQRRWRLISARAAGSLRAVFRSDYGKGLPFAKVLGIHSKGWSVEDWNALNVASRKGEGLLSTVDYRRMHPLNGTYSSWIDDKLILKYLCYAEDLKGLMPEYYFQIEGGVVLSLPDCPDEHRDEGVEGVLSLLEEKGVLALKQIKGSLGEGFYKAELAGGGFRLNGDDVSREELRGVLSSLEGYIGMEYLYPHESMRVFSTESPNTIRYLVGRVDGEPKFLKSFIRFGTVRSGFVENYNSGGVLCYIDKNGYYDGGNLLDLETGENAVVKTHPDTGEPLSGRVPLWDELVSNAEAFCRHFPQLTYLGFDFVVASNNEVKMLEINSLTSLDSIQLDSSVLQGEPGSFFKERLE